MNLNVGCGRFRTDLKDWVNTDVIRLEGEIEPDVVVSPDEPLPFADASFDRIYMGHVLEHVPWTKVVPFLQLAAEKLVSGGKLLVVGPDVNRSLQMWHEGSESLEHLLTVLEDDLHTQETEVKWFGEHHYWNAYEARVLRALNAAGFKNAKALDIGNESLFAQWPVTSHARWQMAVIATK